MQKRGGWDSAQLKETGEARQSAIRITQTFWTQCGDKQKIWMWPVYQLILLYVKF